MSEGYFRTAGKIPRRKMRKLLSWRPIGLAVALLSLGSLAGQGSYWAGQVLDSRGHPIPGAVIYGSVTSAPAFSDSAGYFRLARSVTGSKLIVTAQGYSARSVSLAFSQNEQLRIYLSRVVQDSSLEAHISPDSLLQSILPRQPSGGYQRLLYEKRQAYLHRVPFSIWPLSGFFLPREQDTGMIYWREGLYRDQWQKPDHFHRQTLKKREGGHILFGENFTLADWQMDLRGNELHLKREYALSLPGPLSVSGMEHYRYRVLGQYRWDTLRVYRLEFCPESYRPQSLQGRADLREDGVLLQASYRLPGPHRLPLIDSMKVRQLYRPVGRGVSSTLLRQEIDYYTQLLGFRGSFHIDQSIQKSGDFDPEHRTESFPYELDRYQRESYQARPSFWDSLRPVDQVSPAIAASGRNYLDEGVSLKAAPRRRFFRSARLFRKPFSLWKWAYQGYEFRGDSGFYSALPALYLGLGYNALEGSYLHYTGVLGYSRDTTEWTLYPSLGYGLADERWKYKARLSYRYGAERPQELSMAGGREYSQFNRKEPVSALLNTFYSTVFGENLVRLYGRDFASLAYEGEPRNGLALEGRITYARRFPLSVKASPFTWTGEERFDANELSLRQEEKPYRLDRHRALTWSGELSYQLGQRYRQRYSLRYATNFRQKENLITWLPRFYYRFRAGLPWLGASTAYYHHAAGLRYRYRTGNYGQAYVDLSAGHFPWREAVKPVDYRHFDGARTFFLEALPQGTAPTNQYNTLPYYRYSTDGTYLEGHFVHDFEGSLLHRWGFWPRSKAQLQLGLNALWLAKGYYYLEGYLGLTQIWKWANFSFTSGWNDQNDWHTAFRLSLALDYLFYAKHNLQ